MPDVIMPVCFSKVLPKHSAQVSSIEPQDVLIREDGLHDWEATKLMEAELPFLSCFTLKWDVWWVGLGFSSGGKCSCGYLAAFVTADTAGSPWFGDANSSVDPSTGEGCVSLKLNSCSYYTV